VQVAEQRRQRVAQGAAQVVGGDRVEEVPRRRTAQRHAVRPRLREHDREVRLRSRRGYGSQLVRRAQPLPVRERQRRRVPPGDDVAEAHERDVDRPDGSPTAVPTRDPQERRGQAPPHGFVRSVLDDHHDVHVAQRPQARGDGGAAEERGDGRSSEGLLHHAHGGPRLVRDGRLVYGVPPARCRSSFPNDWAQPISAFGAIISE
jgi:hypothetical protein